MRKIVFVMTLLCLLGSMAFTLAMRPVNDECPDYCGCSLTKDGNDLTSYSCGCANGRVQNLKCTYT